MIYDKIGFNLWWYNAVNINQLSIIGNTLRKIKTGYQHSKQKLIPGNLKDLYMEKSLNLKKIKMYYLLFFSFSKFQLSVLFLGMLWGLKSEKP
jgi:hypothetical protein